ncbi:MAG TPA: apolipoprotein N-acyltransferase [Terriglobales bacterium]|nr:apolipoprotein N-acyltransferase [Terriglobales bacterium]
MRRIGKKAWLLAIASGVLQVLVFPAPDLYWLGWICLAPLLVALGSPRADGERPSPGQGFLLAWTAGILWIAVSCYWIYDTLRVYGHLHPLIAAGLLLLFCLYFAIPHGLFGMLFALAARLPRLGTGLALALSPAFWVTAELLRARSGPFPWDLLGTSQVENVPLARIATVTGVYGLSFAIVVVNAAFALAWLLPAPRRRATLVAGLASVLALQAGVVMKPSPSPAAQTAVLVQPNIPILDANWTMEFFQQTLEHMSRLSASGSQQAPSPRLVVWPESPAPFYERDPRFREPVSQAAQATDSWIVAGTLGTRPAGPESARRSEVLNSASLISPQGEWTGRYDKVHLVPFGEYVPFRRILFFAESLTKEVGDFTPGERRTVMRIDGHEIAVVICFEAIFPDEVRQFVAGGAEVLVNISNDTWLGQSGGVRQHLNMARMRAIENRRWVLRATNSGITAVIDPEGRVVARAARDAAAALVAPYGFVSSTTFYTRHGDVFAFLCAIITIAALAWALRPART